MTKSQELRVEIIRLTEHRDWLDKEILKKNDGYIACMIYRDWLDKIIVEKSAEHKKVLYREINKKYKKVIKK
jgi:hypothetical protein